MPCTQLSQDHLLACFRPHPSATDTSPWNLPANAATAPLDRLRDAVRFGTMDPAGKILGGSRDA
jgi:hypothetical protein